MGCDIHLFVEKKIDGKWWSVGGKRDFHRCYIDFAILADVRNREGSKVVKPISEPRGIPEDCDDAARIAAESWDGDAHSHSWLLLSELVDYDWRGVGDYGYGEGQLTDDLIPYLKSLSVSPALDDVRVVFFFDN